MALMVLAGCSVPASSPEAATVGPSDTPPTTAPASASLEPSKVPVDAYSVSEALSLRDAGTLGADQFALEGFWTNRTIMHSCAPPPQPQGEIDVWCAEGDYGITEANEAIGQLVNHYQFLPAASAHLTPYVSEELFAAFFSYPNQYDVPPVPIVVIGHFNDPRSADCHESRIQACRDRFVLDDVLVFDPASVPPATPAPTPTPFPSPHPPPMFGKELCAGDVEYEFIGWTTTDQLGIDIRYDGHIFAMVTQDVLRLNDWTDDPAGSGERYRAWGQRICYSEDAYIGQEFNVVPMGFALVEGTGFREWEDGRRESMDSP